MDHLKYGRDYGIKLGYPTWFKVVSCIPIINLFVSQKVKIDVTLFNKKGEPMLGTFRRTRVPRNIVKYPMKVSVAWPEHVVGGKKLIRVLDKYGNCIYVREYNGEFTMRACSWVDNYELTRIDQTNPKE